MVVNERAPTPPLNGGLPSCLAVSVTCSLLPLSVSFMYTSTLYLHTPFISIPFAQPYRQRHTALDFCFDILVFWCVRISPFTKKNFSLIPISNAFILPLCHCCFLIPTLSRLCQATYCLLASIFEANNTIHYILSIPQKYS
ncbi:hypothetical protein DL96DRAFT_859412 [Flagelloscypha sp. PMI_526]|nr:hypothetical protein DL96DRAFT_859412 [Flagelloscypha sp. PMI_526]